MKYLALLLALTSLTSAQTGTVNPTGGGIVNPEFRNAVLPAQSTHSGKFLTTDGSGAVSWATVTSNLTSGPVTSSAGVSAIANGAIGVAKITGLGTAATAAATDFALRAKSFFPEDYGAKGDTRVEAVALTNTSGSSTITVSPGIFTAADVGKLILVPAAGSAGATIYTTIATFVSSSSVTLSVNTGITLAGNAVNIVIATNDDAAVQAAIDAAEVAGGKVILSRKYGLLAGVTLERGWVSIEGFSGGGYYEDGMDASGFFCMGSATCAITVQSGYAGKTLRGNTFRDFSITGPEDYRGGTTRGIWFKYRGAPYEIPGDCPLVDRVNLQFIKLGIWAETTDSLSVTNCRICNLGTGLWLKNAINTTVSNNIIWDNPDYGIYMQGSGYGALITGNAMGRSAYDIVCDEAQSCTITGNAFTNDDSTPGVTHNSAIKVIAGGVNSRMAITGNTFTGSNPAGSVMRWLNAVIELTLSDNINISGNQFHYLSSTQPAVKIDRCNSINVSANSFSTDTLRPISLVGANSKIHLGDNQHNGIITIPTPSQLDPIRTDGLRIFADNAAAIAGGLPLGASYVTTSGAMAVCIEDAAAKAYSDAVAAAGATVTTAQRQLISQFVAGEKAESRWMTHKRLYMFGWASANANKIDMVTATALGTWTGVTHSAGFSQANGSTQYFSLDGAAGDFGLTNANCSISVVCYAGDTRNAYAAYMGQAVSGNQAMSILEDESNNIEFYGFHGAAGDLAGPTGVILGTRNAFANYQTYRRSASGLTTINYNANAGTAATATWEVWRRGADGLPSNAKIGGAGVHTGMNSTAATAYTAAMKTLWEGLYGLTLP